MPWLPAGLRRTLRLCIASALIVTVVEHTLLVFRLGFPAEIRRQKDDFIHHAVMVELRSSSGSVNTPDTEDLDDHPPVRLNDLNVSKSQMSLPPPVTAHPLSKNERLFYQRRDTKVNPFYYKFLIEGDQICDEQTEMVIIVHSSASFTDRRRAIRRTWGSVVNGGEWPHNRTIGLNLKLAFIFGLHKDPAWNAHLRRENEELGDVIQGDFLDTYKNMTLKSLLGLKWVTEKCPSVKYLLKSDDDMFLNLPSLVRAVESSMPRRSILGPLCLGSPVSRVGKWGIPKSLFPFSRYPPYEAGSAYVITGDIITELFETSEYVPAIFIDDVYITGILGRIIHVEHVRRRGFAYAVTRLPKPCQAITGEVLTGHRVRGARLLSFWDSLQKTQAKDCKVSNNDKSINIGPNPKV